MDSAINNITIPYEEYKQLLITEARVNIIISNIRRNKYMSLIDILYMFGTPESIDIADALKGDMMEINKGGFV